MSESAEARRARIWNNVDRRRRIAGADQIRLFMMVAELFPEAGLSRRPGDRTSDDLKIALELPVGRYIVDIALPWMRIALENDESSANHHGPTAKRREALRDRALNKLGWSVVHVRHKDFVFVANPHVKLAAMIGAAVHDFDSFDERWKVKRGLKKTPIRLCGCGCGERARPGRKYIHGHHMKAMNLQTAEVRSKRQRTKRERFLRGDYDEGIKKAAQRLVESNQSEKRRKQRSDEMRKRWGDPETRKRLSEAIREGKSGTA